MERSYGTIRDTLESLEEARSEVARLERRVRYLRTKSTSVTRSYGVKGGSGTYSDIWCSLSDASARLEDKTRKLRQMEEQVSHWIDLLPRPRWRVVLRCRYLDGMEMQDIADELSRAAGRSISVTQIYRLHREALASAEKLWPIPS